MTRVWRLAITFFACTASSVAAQASPDAISQHLFPPELVMQHQQKIDLRPDQRRAITEAIQQLQSSVVELQWRMQDETQKLAGLLEAVPVNEAGALAQIDRILNVEREIKRAHVAMLIRIKNSLTREQQATLRSLR